MQSMRAGPENPNYPPQADDRCIFEDARFFRYLPYGWYTKSAPTELIPDEFCSPEQTWTADPYIISVVL